MGISRYVCAAALGLSVGVFPGMKASGQGAWTPLANPAPDYNKGVMILLSDGSVICKTSSGGSDVHGSFWNKLTPDIHGSYVNGTWDLIQPMTDTRLYFSSQMLKDGRVYVAGGEYGTGRAFGEVYDPITDFWTPAPRLAVAADTLSDANSEILEDGKVLQAVVSSGHSVSNKTYLYDPVTNTYAVGPPTIGIANESAWIKLQDNSVLFVDINSTASERYIPATNTWVADATVPVGLYDPYGKETGAALLLPNGKAFFLGSPDKTAYYTPSGNTSPGTWSAGPTIPGVMGAPDAAAAMMVDGTILCAFSPIPTIDSVFHKPMFYYEFNYLADSFTRITAPNGDDSLFVPSYFSNMLCLPDGNVLYCTMGDDQYYIYTPPGAPLPAGKPTLDNIIKVSCDTFIAVGKQFNGITQGAGFGDDWQMATNYPLIRLSSNDTVYYARTFNWNSTGVRRGTKPDTTWFVLPAGLPDQNYSIRVVANGNASDAKPFATCATTAAPVVQAVNKAITIYPNPANKMVTVAFSTAGKSEYSIKLTDLHGRVVKEEAGTAAAGENTVQMALDGVKRGMYLVVISTGGEETTSKLMVR